MINEDVLATKDLENDKSDKDSGLIDDYIDFQLISEAFNVLPDEKTLSIDYDLELDLSDENFGSYNDFIVDNHEASKTCKVDSNNNTNSNINTKKIGVEENFVISDTNKNTLLPGKYREFTKEQARQWRRKRILNTYNQNTIKKKDHSVRVLPNNKLQPLFNVPSKPTVQEKLKDPLLAGEKIGANRGPVPMKHRALPQSFWKEPQAPQSSSLAGSHYSVLPPLFASDESSNIQDMRPVTPPEETNRSPRHKKKVVESEKADTALLFSLFDHLENKIDEKLIVKRGRPKKQSTDQKQTTKQKPKSNNISKDNDPCIVDALADKLFPELSLHQAKEKINNLAAIIKIGKQTSTIVQFPAVNHNYPEIHQNYSEMLNELIAHM
ncbi:uncharacterized protein LOC100210921 [Hydra vulgaris]|uniref:uncharacterized protein LOC100210921 n=1 Tax=Hydra vulgaris TaxID=6087 RepID=UPI0002B43898|nr:uncharacterized protein LOC100210921 [Hydra vulgaris]